MYRGEFRFASGLVVPNNITTVGIQTLLGLALRDETADFFVGLCSAVYAEDLQIESLTEPTIATNGYARLAVERTVVGWPSDGLVNGEPYLESKDLVFVASVGPFDQAVTRMFICFTEAGVTGDVFALSAALPDEFIIDPTTPLVDRTFRYRIYAR